MVSFESFAPDPRVIVILRRHDEGSAQGRLRTACRVRRMSCGSFASSGRHSPYREPGTYGTLRLMVSFESFAPDPRVIVILRRHDEGSAQGRLRPACRVRRMSCGSFASSGRHSPYRGPGTYGTLH